MAGRFATLALAGLVALPLAASAFAPTAIPNAGPPLLLRLHGVIEASEEAARARGGTTVSLGFLSDVPGPTRYLAVSEARTVGGDHPLNGADVLARVAPFKPNLLATGPAPLAAVLRDATPGTPLEVEGLVDTGSRTYYLRRAEIRPASR